MQRCWPHLDDHMGKWRREFVTTIRRQDARRLAAQYRENAPEFQKEGDAFKAGERLAAGDYSRDNLITIVKWKSPRPIPHIKRNSKSDIKEYVGWALKAAQSESIAEAVAALCELDGVEVAMASAILTAFDPTKFTIIDYRALESLGCNATSPYSVGLYMRYLKHCIGLSKRWGIPLRELDQALWLWPEARSKN